MAVKARAEITLSSIRDVQSVTRYYLLQSSTSAIPSKPTTNPPGGNWVTSEPSYTSGSTNSLYFVDLTVFSDGTFAYSNVSLSSSYEAAKVAYNKAVSAEGVANSASDKVDNLQIGGRNLIRRTDYAIYGNDNNYKHYANQSPATFSSDRITVPFGTNIWHSTPYSQNFINKTIPAGTKILCSVYVYEQSISDGNHRLYVSRLKTNGSVTWDNVHTIPHGFTGPLTWVYTPPEDIKGFCLDFDTRNSTNGQMVLGPVKAELGTKPTDWTPAPEDLENAITTSQETADGKNTVYYQNSAPTNQTFKVNDIWFDTDDENKMYHWNGSAWTAAPFGNAAFSNIDAGKVTTGTMSANRIKGDTLTLGGANNVDGMLKVYDANGTLVGSFTREGLMAIAGTIGGWTIGATQLYNTYLEDNAIQHSAAFSPTDELQFSVSDNGTGTTMLDVHDRTAIYGSNGINFAVRTLDDERYQSYVAPRGDDYGVRIGPALDVYGPLSSSSMKSSSLQLQTNMGSYIRQPAMIMSGVATISTGTSEKNMTLCTVPTEYQSGYRIVPFVSRRYGSASGTPSDTGDFYYAYYNSVTHNVHIKLANKLPSGVIFQFDYMIYVVPES